MTILVGGQFTTLKTKEFKDGLCMWNGSTLSPVASSLMKNFSGSDVYLNPKYLVRNSSGHLYVGTTEGVYRWNGTSWSLIYSGQETVAMTINTSTDTVYFAEVNMVFSITAGGTVTQIGQTDGMDYVGALALDASGNLYYSSSMTAIAPGSDWPDPPTTGISVTNYVARWNGSTWTNIAGSGAPTVPSGAALTNGSTIYFGNSYGYGDGDIWTYNGSTWANPTSVGSAIRNMVFNGSDLYIACEGYVRKWNGSTLTVVGSNPISMMRGLAVYGGYLYAGYCGMSGIPAGPTNYQSMDIPGLGYGLAKFNLSGGTAWETFTAEDPAGLGGEVNAILSSGGNLYIAGNFMQALSGAEISGVKSMAKYDGSAWTKSFGAWGTASVTSSWVTKTNLQYDSAGNLYTATSGSWDLDTLYDEAGTTATSVGSGFNKWNGTAWSVLGTCALGGITVFKVVSPTEIYVGGAFTSIGGVSANRIARWNGSQWSALGSGLGDTCKTMAWDGSQLFVLGNFTTAGGSAANRLARWNGTEWSPLGSGLSSNQTDSAMACDGSGNLYVGGQFTTIGGVSANRIARWNGTAWAALGSGVNNTVKALACVGSNVYVGGLFSQAGGVQRYCVAIWNAASTAWSTWGPSATYFYNHRTQGYMETMHASSDGNIYVGFVGLGNYGIKLDSDVDSLFKWNGTAWSACGGSFGVGPLGSVSALTDEPTPDTTAPTPGNSGTITTADVASTTLTLNWTKATDDVSDPSALQYLAYRSTSSSFDTLGEVEAGTPIGSYTADINTKSVTGLSDGTTYYFNVVVKDEAENKAVYTKKMQATTDVTGPTPGSSGTITTSNVGETTLDLSWTKANDNVSPQANLQYLAYYSLSSTLDSVSDVETNGTAIGSYTADIAGKSVTGLTVGETYYFNVVVKDEAENKAAYTKKSQTMADTTGPVPGNSGSLSAASVTSTSLTLNWTKANDNVSPQANLQYLAYYSSSSSLDSVSQIELNGTSVGTYTADINTKAISGLTPAAQYYFNVVVKDELDNKAPYTKLLVAFETTVIDDENSTVGDGETVEWGSESSGLELTANGEVLSGGEVVLQITSLDDLTGTAYFIEVQAGATLTFSGRSVEPKPGTIYRLRPRT